MVTLPWAGCTTRSCGLVPKGSQEDASIWTDPPAATVMAMGLGQPADGAATAGDRKVTAASTRTARHSKIFPPRARPRIQPSPWSIYL